MSNSLKHTLLTLGFIALLIISPYLLIAFSFGGYPFPELLPILFIIFYIWIWVTIGLKKRRRYPICLLLISTVAYFGYITRIEYERSIPTVREFSSTSYQPFYSDRLVKLDAPSNLTLTENLPRLDGSTALYPMYAAFVQAVYDQKAYRENDDVLSLSKTSAAYDKLLKGGVDIIFVPAPSKNHLEKAKQQGVEFKLTPIGKEAFVFFVNSQNRKINNLTVEQIQGIYSGKITNWKELDGDNEKIRAFQRPENSGSQTALQKLMGDIPIMPAPREDVPASMGGIINQVANYRNFDNALGFSFLLYSTELVKSKEIKLLNINGITPNHENIRAKTYPFTYDIFAVTLGNESKETQQLLEWITSPQGRELIEKVGYVSEIN